MSPFQTQYESYVAIINYVYNHNYIIMFTYLIHANTCAGELMLAAINDNQLGKWIELH